MTTSAGALLPYRHTKTFKQAKNTGRARYGLAWDALSYRTQVMYRLAARTRGHIYTRKIPKPSLSPFVLGRIFSRTFARVVVVPPESFLRLDIGHCFLADPPPRSVEALGCRREPASFATSLPFPLFRLTTMFPLHRPLRVHLPPPSARSRGGPSPSCLLGALALRAPSVHLIHHQSERSVRHRARHRNRWREERHAQSASQIITFLPQRIHLRLVHRELVVARTERLFQAADVVCRQLSADSAVPQRSLFRLALNLRAPILPSASTPQRPVSPARLTDS